MEFEAVSLCIIDLFHLSKKIIQSQMLLMLVETMFHLGHDEFVLDCMCHKTPILKYMDLCKSGQNFFAILDDMLLVIFVVETFALPILKFYLLHVLCKCPCVETSHDWQLLSVATFVCDAL